MPTPDVPKAEQVPSGNEARAAPDRQPQGSTKADAPPHPGMAPAKGELLEAGVQSRMHDAPPCEPSPVDRTIKEGAVYTAANGEERLVWVVRDGAVQYFTRREGCAWRGMQDTAPPAIADFVKQVGLTG